MQKEEIGKMMADCGQSMMSGVDHIRLAIEYLIGLTAEQAKAMDKMDKDLRSRNYIVDKLMKETGERDKVVKE